MCRYKLLVVTKSTVDVIGMQQYTRKPSCYRMGRKRQGGCPMYDAKIVFVTDGLLLRWYAARGAEAFYSYDGIFFDEMDQMEMNPEYALLWEVAVKVSSRQRLRISGASAAFSNAMMRKLAQREAKWIECFERPYTVERYVAVVTSTSEMYSVLVHVTMSLLDRGCTSLVFLPGKWEISSVLDNLVAAGVDMKFVVPFHADLDVPQLEAAKRGADYPRIVLSTSLAETSITLPDVDVVIDLGLSRRRAMGCDVRVSLTP